MPEADAQGVVPLGLELALIRIGDARILVDPGFGAPGSPHDRAFAGLVLAVAAYVLWRSSAAWI